MAFPGALRNVGVTLCLLTGALSAVGAQPAAGARLAPAPLEACLTLEETTLRGDLNRVTQAFFSDELSAVDLPRMVERKWLELGMPALLETEVDRVIDSVRDDTGNWGRFTSSLLPARTTALATRIADRAFSSEAFRRRLETLADEVAADLTGSFTAVAERSASSATACVQTYLGNAYGASVATAFEGELRAQLEATGAAALTGDIEPGSTVGLRSGVGVATIAGGYVARTVAQRLSAQLSRRIAGNIAARLLGRVGSSALPVVGWAVGGGLIAWDVASGAVRGPFPAIRAQLAGEETQAQIQAEIVRSLREDLPALSAELSRGVSDELYTQWRQFTRNFETVLRLAERDAAFRRELGGVPEIDLYKLAEVVRLVPERSVLQAARDGQLRQVVELPEDALEILQTSPSPAAVLAWADLAGTRLDEVVAREVYRYKEPEDFSQTTLTRLLDTDDVVTIAKVAALPRAAMDTLLELSTATLKALAGEFSSSQLETIAWYADALAQESFNALVVRIIERPSRLEKFAPPAVRNAVVGSREPLTAVAFLGSEPSFGLAGSDLIGGFGRDLSAVLGGSVSARLLFAKYDVSSLLALLALLTALLFAFRTVLNLLKRPFRRRKPS